MPPKKGLVSSAVASPSPPYWLYADEGRDSTSSCGDSWAGEKARAWLLWARLIAHFGFPRPFIRGSTLLFGLWPPKKLSGGWEETMDKKPLFGGDLPTGVSC